MKRPAKQDPSKPKEDGPQKGLVIRRSRGAGFSGIENHPLYVDNTHMMCGGAQKVPAALIHAIKAVA